MKLITTSLCILHLTEKYKGHDEHIQSPFYFEQKFCFYFKPIIIIIIIIKIVLKVSLSAFLIVS